MYKPINNIKQNYHIHGWGVYRKMLILLVITSTIWNFMNYLSSRSNISSSPEYQQFEQTSSSSPSPSPSPSPSHNNISPSPKNVQLEPTSSILQDCKDKCKFIFPYFMPEQETKANLHIRSFVRLAEALDRILVISNVGISRVRACTTFSPSFYYNLKLLQEMFPNAKFITQKEYELWVDNQSNNEKIVAEHFLFNALRNITLNDYEGPQQHGPNGLYKTFTIANSSSLYYKKRMNYIKHYKTCPYDLKLNKLNLTKLKEVRLFRSGFLTNSVEKREMFSKFLTKALESDSQVLLISSNFRQPLFPDMREPIPYAEHILNEASKIIDRLESSYIAIHWRMEQTRSANLPGCAKELVRTINEIKKHTRIKNVYLATDFPTSYNKNGSIMNPDISNVMKTQSDTFSDITAQHIRAMNILTSSIEGIETWKSLNAFGYLNYIGKEEGEREEEEEEEEEEEKKHLIDELEGPGVQGILDKLVCINSNYFLSGPRGCCRITSGFTKQIAVSRTQLLIEGNPNILNTITRWSASDSSILVV